MSRRVIWWVVALAIMVVPSSRAFAEKFDVMSYAAPKTWASSVKNGVLTLTKSDPKTGTFGVIVVAPSAASAGSADQDFKVAWDTVVVPGFKVSGAPQSAPPTTENGWTAKTAGAKGEVNGAPAGVILVTMTGYGKSLRIVITTNHDDYSEGIASFLGSVKLDTLKTTPPPTPPPPATGDGATTTFSDGWTAKAERDWVRVTRPGATVLLHYAVALDDRNRNATTEWFWAELVGKRYTLSNVAIRAWSPVNFPYYFAQADAVDRATGAKGHVALRIVTANGIASPIEVFTASRDAFTKLFPDQDKLAAIQGANRFALGKSISGTWTGGTGAALQMVYVATGGSAGMNVAVSSDKFVFGADGKYTSEHKGASGMVGSQKVFQVSYKGTYTLAPWELAVKRSDGTSSKYSAYYELTRGGSILHLQDKQYSGLTFNLAKK